MVRRLVLLVAASLLVGCGGGKGAESPAEAKTDLDADPLGLVPGQALVVASVDMHAVGASTNGPAIAQLADSFVPFGDDAGFQLTRDVDKILVATYAANESDVAGVVSGRFDVAKLNAVQQTRQGTPITHSTYAGFTTDTAGAVTIVPLTAKTVVAGTTERVHRVLDRVQQKTLTRAVPGWVGDTLATQGAAFAVAADFSWTPIAAATLGAVNLSWLKGLQVARILGDLNPPGLNVAATLTYADAAGAQAAADGVRQLDTIQKLFAPALLGAHAENLTVTPAGNDVSCKFAVSDQSLQALAQLAGKFVHP